MMLACSLVLVCCRRAHNAHMASVRIVQTVLLIVTMMHCTAYLFVNAMAMHKVCTGSTRSCNDPQIACTIVSITLHFCILSTCALLFIYIFGVYRQMTNCHHEQMTVVDGGGASCNRTVGVLVALLAVAAPLLLCVCVAFLQYTDAYEDLYVRNSCPRDTLYEPFAVVGPTSHRRRTCG
jgi:hypothetical protein